MTVDGMSDLDLSYTPPLGSPWDAVQMATQAWVRDHQLPAQRSAYAPRACHDQRKPTVLFVCVHNAGRSQLAAGLAAPRGGDQVTVLSAGPDPDDEVSDVALASLAEPASTAPTRPPPNSPTT